MNFDPQLANLLLNVNNQHPQTLDEICTEEDKVILQPVTMRIPNEHCVYSPSKIRSNKVMSYREFLTSYAQYAKGIRVCFDETPDTSTIFQKSRLVTAYGSGLNCWYIVAEYCLVEKKNGQVGR